MMYEIKSILIKIKRFPLPLTPNEFKARQQSPKILANSFPKAGTHLVCRLLFLFPLLVPRWQEHLNQSTPKIQHKLEKIRPGQYISGHLYWNEELVKTIQTNNIRNLFIVRDLRDLAVSNFYYITYKNPQHRLHSYFKSLNSDAERLMASIAGVDGQLLPDGISSKSIGEHAQAYVPWIDEPTCLTIRFEDLIGSRGGGSERQQIQTISAIAEHLSIDLSAKQISQIADRVFYQNSRTFRKGTIGDWRSHFTPEHQRIFEEVAGEAAIKFGYGE